MLRIFLTILAFGVTAAAFVNTAHAGKIKADIEDGTISRNIDGGGREVINCKRGWIAIFGTMPDSGVALIDLVDDIGQSGESGTRVQNVKAECEAQGIRVGF